MLWKKIDDSQSIEDVIARNFNIGSVDEIKNWEYMADNRMYKVARMEKPRK